MTPQVKRRARLHVGAALAWLAGVTVLQLTFGYFGHEAVRASRYYTLGEVIDVSDGPPMRWTSGFPLAAGEVTCERTMWRVSFHPSVGRSGDPRLECVPGPGSTRPDVRSSFSWIVLIADVLLTAIPLAIAAALAGGRYPLLVLPGILLGGLLVDAVPRPEGPVGPAVWNLAWWAGALVLMPAIAAAWRRLRRPSSAAVPPRATPV